MTNYREIRTLIGKYQMEDAFAKMMVLFEDKPGLQTEVTLLKSRYHRNLKDIDTAHRDYRETDQAKNAIVRASLDLLDWEKGMGAPPEPTAGIPPVLGLLPPGLQNFIGRERELEDVHRQLFQKNSVLLLVNGRGGVGKTTLAARYYQKYRHQYAHIAWVLKEQSIASSLLSILPVKLDLSFGEAEPEASRFQRLLERMAALNGPCLLILDNANEADDLDQYYQGLSRCDNFHILLTTRITEFEYLPTYRIEGLPEDEAITLFETYYQTLNEEEIQILKAIREAVYENTLVLELLAKNLSQVNPFRRKKGYGLQELLSDIQEKGLLKLTKIKEVKTIWQSYERATPEQIIGAMYDIGHLADSPDALKVMARFSILPSENISLDILEELLGEDAIDALQQLRQLGWLDYDEAEESFRCSPVIQEIVREKHPDLWGDCEEMIRVLYDGLSEDKIHIGNYQKAGVYSRLGEAIVSIGLKPKFILGILCQNIGKFHTDTGDLLEAMNHYQKMEQIFVSLMQDSPDDSDLQNGLAISYSKLGNTHSSLGNLEKALSYYEEYNQLREDLYARYPQNVSFQNGLAISYSKLGETHSSLGNLEKALSYYEEYNVLEKDLHESYPQNVSFQNGLAISYSKLGETHRSLGNLEKALSYYEEYNVLEKDLHESYPQNVEFTNNLAISYEKLGNTHSSLGNLEKALSYYEEYNVLEKDLHESYPQNVSFQNGLAISYSKLGETHSSLGNLEKALSYYEEYNVLEKDLHESYPQNVSFQNGLAISYSKLGETHSSLGNLEKALSYYEEYNVLEKDLHESYPQNVSFQNGLAISYEKLGNTHSSLGNLEKALSYYEEDLKLTKTLAESYPQNVSFQNGLAISYIKLAFCYEETNVSKLLEYLGQAEDLYDRLVAIAPQYQEFQTNRERLKNIIEELQGRE